MSLSKRNNPKCCVCSKWIKKISGTPKYIVLEEDVVEFSSVFDRDILIGDVVCGNCRMMKYKRKKK